MKLPNAWFSVERNSWSFHIGVPREWGWVWGFSDGAVYGYQIREFGCGPLFALCWESPP